MLIQEKGACDIHEYINRGKFLNYTEIGKYGIARVLKDLPIKDYNVGVASAISSYSRCRLWSLIDGIESKGKHVFMCDTDSVITDAKLNDYPELMKEFMWGLRGWEFCTSCPFFANFSTFTKISQVPSFQAHSPVKTVICRNAKKRPKIAKHTKHELLPKRVANFLKFPLRTPSPGTPDHPKVYFALP